MKAIVNNIFRLLLGLIVALAFTACEFKETIVFDENGGGKIATSFFGEQLGDMLESFKEDSIEIGKERFSMQDFIEENKASIDSLSQEKQKEIYDLADTEFFMENQNGDLLISVKLDFDSVDEINKKIKDSRRAINYQLNQSSTSASELESDGNASLEDQMDIKYTWEGNVFERKTYVKDKEAYTEAVKGVEDEIMLAGAMNYVLEYTFPYEVIAISPENATLSVDRKTVVLRSSFSKILKNPKELDLKVTLKK